MRSGTFLPSLISILFSLSLQPRLTSQAPSGAPPAPTTHPHERTGPTGPSGTGDGTHWRVERFSNQDLKLAHIRAFFIAVGACPGDNGDEDGWAEAERILEGVTLLGYFQATSKPEDRIRRKEPPTLLGMIAIRFNPTDMGEVGLQRANLQELVVLPEHQNAGVGSRLVRAALSHIAGVVSGHRGEGGDTAEGNGAENLKNLKGACLEVDDSNCPALCLYLKVGFRVAGRRDNNPTGTDDADEDLGEVVEFDDDQRANEQKRLEDIVERCRKTHRVSEQLPHRVVGTATRGTKTKTVHKAVGYIAAGLRLITCRGTRSGAPSSESESPSARGRPANGGKLKQSAVVRVVMVKDDFGG
jgi:ribosomal protein S18 acetylase RimI-like enzyme